MSKTVTTFCRICIAGCGIEVTVGDDNRIERIAPDKENPHTWRDFCAKARTAGELIEHPRRILNPMRRVGDRYVDASWEEAVSDIAARLRRIMDQHGPDAIGAYWGNPGGFSSSNVMGTDQYRCLSWPSNMAWMSGSHHASMRATADWCSY